MRFPSIALLVSSCLASLASASIMHLNSHNAPGRHQNFTCSTGIHIMIAGGCGIPCPVNTAGILSGLVSRLTVAYPGTDTYYVPYNMSMIQGRVSTVLMEEAIDRYGQQCPHVPIVLLGWSLGGVVVMNTACSGVRSPIMQRQIIAGVTYGEETYVAGMSYNAGSCANNAPKYPRNTTSLCMPWAPKIRDYCDAADPACCTGGTNLTAHSVYNLAYDTDAFNFIVANYNSR